jgi:hypothetical protein
LVNAIVPQPSPARTADWKLNPAGELFDMKEAPFEETLVARKSTDAEVMAACEHR